MVLCFVFLLPYWFSTLCPYLKCMYIFGPFVVVHFCLHSQGLTLLFCCSCFVCNLWLFILCFFFLIDFSSLFYFPFWFLRLQGHPQFVCLQDQRFSVDKVIEEEAHITIFTCLIRYSFSIKYFSTLYPYLKCMYIFGPFAIVHFCLHNQGLTLLFYYSFFFCNL